MRSLALTILLFAGVAGADPIPDMTFDAVKAGWFPSINTPCSKVCETISPSHAEHELFQVPSLSNKYSHVCKARAGVGGDTPGEGELYGNNFSTPNMATFCLVSTHQGSLQRLNRFFCLCAY